MSDSERNAFLRSRLEAAVLGDGAADLDLRRAAFAADNAAADDAEIGEPYRTLVDLVRDASYRVTDEDVAAVRDAAGGDRAAFEVILAAAAGAGVRRWDAAARAIAEATDAPD
ncbi:hypothetical protein GCM10022240_01660 [Microbacterium kribbense]|uniref:Uncharacterized protein n=1 Tax=Microbacterium kribbense TaxID=433645 RepID=A0ABP7FZ97_9MICO